MNLKTRLRSSAMRYLSSARYLEQQPLCTRRSVDYPPGEGINPRFGKGGLRVGEGARSGVARARLSPAVFNLVVFPNASIYEIGIGCRG